jgi:outer membrane protein assembly factor BamC
MVKLGAPQVQAQATAAVQPENKPTSRVSAIGSQPVVLIDEPFDRAWRRVGLALDRTGFTVEDRDRSQGTYFVRYVPPNADKKEPGFFGKMFSRTSNEQPLKYRITVKGEGQTTTVAVLNAGGAPEASQDAQRIVQVIADDLK